MIKDNVINIITQKMGENLKWDAIDDIRGLNTLLKLEGEQK